LAARLKRRAEDLRRLSHVIAGARGRLGISRESALISPPFGVVVQPDLTRFSMRKLALPVLAAISLAACSAAPGALAGDTAPLRTITVSGEGESAGVPDIAILSIGVETEGRTVAEALEKNAAQMSAAIAKLKARGVAPKDMQTRNLSVGPRYDYSNDGRPPRIVGYTAQNSLTVKLRDLAKAGSIIDDAVADGANNLGGISFTFDDPKPLMDEARKAAVKDARARAELYAAAAGVTLGQVMQIQDGYAAPPSPAPMMEMRAVAKAASTPIETGESTVAANVTMVFEIR
jgi:uncharacterized protein YggE